MAISLDFDTVERINLREASRIAARDVVAAERGRQDAKFGKVPRVLTDLRFLAILGEEYGEVCKELVERNDRIDVIAEVVHVAAVATQWIEQYYYDKLAGESVDQPTDGGGS